MTMDKALATAERGEHELTTKERTKVVESLVIRGDWSGLGAAERVRAYNALCAGYGLNPLSRPFEFLKLQGKDVLYARREATDQLAAMHRVNREIVDGPKLIDLAGTKLIYCVVRATLPNGRVENSTATLPLTDPANVLMKCETKGKRRATLAILGMGMLSEDEVDSIPGAVRVQHEALPESAGNPPPDDVAESLADVVNLAELRAWYVALDLRSDDTDASEHASGLAADRLSTLGYRLSSVEHNAALGGTLPDELRYVHDALSGVRDVPACLALCHTLRVDASDAAKRAMARYFGALCSPPITDPKKAGRALAAALNPPPPPTGTDGPACDSSDPAAAIGATVAAANAQHGAAQASAEPRVVLDPAEAEARLLRADAVGDAAWAQRLVDYVGVFAMAGAYHKRREAFAAAGVLATRRAQTLDAIEAREQRGPEAARQALDGYATRRVMPRGYGEVIRLPQRPTATRTGTDG